MNQKIQIFGKTKNVNVWYHSWFGYEAFIYVECVALLFLIYKYKLLYTGSLMAPPINFEASQLQQEGLVWSNLHINLVTWVPTMTKAKQMFENVNSVRAMQVVGLNGLFS